MVRDDALLTAEQAARLLGVTRQTLYAYVSRGLLVSEPGPGPSRARRYPRAAVERLRAGRGRRAAAETGARGSLDWGLPVVDSALTLIERGGFAYRGIDALRLSREETFERVAALLWTGSLGAAERLFGGLPPLRASGMAADPAAAMARALLRQSREPSLSLSAPRDAVLHRAARLLCELARAAGGRGGGGVARCLGRGWGVACADDLDAALVLCADHELNVSSFAARCVASTDARLEHVLLAALCALQGRRHGGSYVRVGGLLDTARRSGARAALERTLGELGDLPGFGHPLYPDGDPRAAALIERASAGGNAGPAVELAAVALDRYGVRPNLDFGLLALVRARRLHDRAAFALFALGRSAGWVAHALEAADEGRLVRPRARYVGPRPPA